MAAPHTETARKRQRPIRSIVFHGVFIHGRYGVELRLSPAQGQRSAENHLRIRTLCIASYHPKPKPGKQERRMSIAIVSKLQESRTIVLNCSKPLKKRPSIENLPIKQSPAASKLNWGHLFYYRPSHFRRFYQRGCPN
jgi:hypothetical protein